MHKNALIFISILIPSSLFACMPPFPWEVMIGRVSSLWEISSWILNVGYSTYAFPFREYAYEEPTSWKYRPYDDFSSRHEFPKDIHTGSIIVALSDAQDGSFPHDYSIFHITTLLCENNIIELWPRDGIIYGWNRKKWSGCGYQANSLLDVFPEGDEDIWIKKLQEKYPTCDDLEKAFPMKQEISIESIKAPSLENDVTVYSTGFLWLDWILQKIDNFFKLF